MMSMDIAQVGDWARIRSVLQQTPAKVKSIGNKAIKQELQLLRKTMLQGIKTQAPGGKKFKPLSRNTLRTRQLARRRSTKALIGAKGVGGDLWGSISIVPSGGKWFVGVNRKAKKSKGGTNPADIAALNEFGSRPIVIPITPRMRRFLAVLFKGRKSGTGLKRGAGVVVLVIPKRPFIQPAFDTWVKDLQHRFLTRVLKQLPEFKAV